MGEGTNENSSLTGVWHGLYTYPDRAGLPETPFTAVVLDSGGYLSGTIHEILQGWRGARETNAVLTGSAADNAVSFTKAYDGTNGVKHAVHYDGHLNGERDEIEGQWNIKDDWSGRFLMIRKRGQGVAAKVEAFEQT